MAQELNKTYAPQALEDRIYQMWCDKGYFTPKIDHNKTPYTIVIPPPNITGQLHMGHALDDTLQDILIRYKRMRVFAHYGCLAPTMLPLQQRQKLSRQ